MKRLAKACVVALGMLALSAPALAYEAMVGPTGVLKYDKDKAYNGYTVISPTVKSKTTYLIDMEGKVVHEWKCQYTAGLYAELLPNGNLLRAGYIPQKDNGIGGVGGIVQELDWDGKVVWEYKMADKDHYQHHTFKRMPNGNTLILGWERKTKQETLAKGRDPKTIPDKAMVAKGVEHNDFWVDFVREVDKDGKTVWEWHAWDHIGKGPKKLDINYTLPLPMGSVYPNFDWSHFNTVDYLPGTDQVLVNSRNLSEFYLINHKTGAIEYRWGNPSAYGAGKAPSWYDDGDQQVFGEHCVTPLDNGHMLLFDNGSERPEGNRSRVVEMDPKTGKVVWEYTSKDVNSFFSFRQGAVQKLPNGNVLVTSTHHGHIFEVTPEKQIVWDYVSPVAADVPKCVLDEDKDSLPDAHLKMMTNAVHRAYRYGPDYPGLKGRDLGKKTPMVPGGCPLFFKEWKNPAPAKS
jgi:hypothetical protein